ncbi:hypothetical protein MLD38_002836 [Melastoma candidum]|uniref:Uncharacterized protein n=1 Tax=Melastoma candidum TaxID=119954 RepID=A0ACB9RZV8_9MYRT|nr:hypothetical protein MLD38_002836 [Melastoma candidum]
MSLRRSFGGSGSMFSAVGRGVVSARAGVPGGSAGLQDPVAGNTTAPTSPRNASGQKLHHQLSLTACSSPVSPRSSGCAVPSWQGVLGVDEGDWVFADGGWEDTQRRKDLYFEELVLGPVPSTEEVQAAVSAVQQAFDSTAYSHLIKDRYGPYMDKEVTDVANGSSLLNGASSGGTNVDWIEPALHLCNDSTRALQPFGKDIVFDAFDLLQKDPSVQRMVISLSSDKAVWDAVLNNEVVKELRTSCSAGEVTSLSNESFSDESDEANEVNEAATVIKWLFDHTVLKIMEMVDKLTRLVSDLFNNSIGDQEPSVQGRRADRIPFEEKLRTSFLLSVVVLLVVAMTRARGA